MNKETPVLKRLIFIISCLTAVSSSASYDGYHSEDFCSLEGLNYKEAVSRNQWALNCGYSSIRDYDYYVYDDSGELRVKPIYPVFFTEDYKIIKMPTDENASCEIDAGRKINFCNPTLN